MNDIKYHIYAISPNGEREHMDFTYDADEAKTWAAEYAAEDEAARAKGTPVPAYTYEIVEEDPDEDEDPEVPAYGYTSVGQALRELCMSEWDFF